MILMDLFGQSVCCAWAADPIRGIAVAAAAHPIK
jgi:hypothetical protein